MGEKEISAEQLVEFKKQLERLEAGSSDLLQDGLLANTTNMHAVALALKEGRELTLVDPDARVPTFMFGMFGSGETKYRQHPNGFGWVAVTAHVDPTAFVHPLSVVHNEAQVLENAHIGMGCHIRGKSIVRGHAKLSGRVTLWDCVVEGSVVVTADVGFVTIYCSSRISDNVIIRAIGDGIVEIEDSKIFGSVSIASSTRVEIRSSSIEGAASISVYGSRTNIIVSRAHIKDDVRIRGNVKIGGKGDGVTIEDSVSLSGDVVVLENVRMMDSVAASGRVVFKGDGRFSGSRHYKRGTHK